MHTALTIAGSDSGAGAGVQADLKTFAAHGVYGTSAITAVTAQNTRGVRAWQALSPDLVVAQIDMVLQDIGADAVKIGMLANAKIVRAVAATLAARSLRHVVLDPVMVAKGGDRLLEPEAVDAVRRELLPHARIVTPNIPEAEVLAGCEIRSTADMHRAGRAILEFGPGVVVLKGGHWVGEDCTDLAFFPGSVLELSGPRLTTTSTHGTGCTLSAAIAANLAMGLPDERALQEARRYLEGAIRHAPAIGRGHGPLNHFWRVY